MKIKLIICEHCIRFLVHVWAFPYNECGCVFAQCVCWKLKSWDFLRRSSSWSKRQDVSQRNTLPNKILYNYFKEGDLLYSLPPSLASPSRLPLAQTFFTQRVLTEMQWSRNAALNLSFWCSCSFKGPCHESTLAGENERGRRVRTRAGGPRTSPYTASRNSHLHLLALP